MPFFKNVFKSRIYQAPPLPKNQGVNYNLSNILFMVIFIIPASLLIGNCKSIRELIMYLLNFEILTIELIEKL